MTKPKTRSDLFHDYVRALDALDAIRLNLDESARQVVELQGVMLQRGRDVTDAADALKRIGVIFPATDF